jgi:hypothetical protein
MIIKTPNKLVFRTLLPKNCSHFRNDNIVLSFMSDRITIMTWNQIDFNYNI